MYRLKNDLLDLNHNGEVDLLEHAMEVDFLTTTKIMLDEDDADLTELEIAGLNPEELGFMDASERRKILEEAGLNPDAFDF